MIHLDISQLLADPRRTGIQRAERELIRHWPVPAPLVPCRYDPVTHTMRELPAEVFGVLCADAGPGGRDAELARLRPFAQPGRAIVPDRLLNAELFPDRRRAAYYRCRDQASFWVVYDFLPWLHPDWFGTGTAAMFMPYLRALREVGNLAFISQRTRDDCGARILHRPQTGPVIPMGADGLGLERQAFSPARRTVVMLGTIETRKNAVAAIRAFQRLWAEGLEAELVMVGLLPTEPSEERSLIEQLAPNLPFRLLSGLPDAGVRAALRDARALLFPSIGEGYGIPPMEALHAGIPVIVSADLPALEGVGKAGCVLLDPPDAASIAAAVRHVLNDDAARRLWAEAAGRVAPSWRDFAAGIAHWVQA